MTGPGQPGGPGAPPPQHNLQTAARQAAAGLAGQTDEQLRRLGAVSSGGHLWRLPVLGSILEVDVARGSVRAEGRDVSPWWRVLVLHYLAVRGSVKRRPPEVVFASLPAARSYASVYQGRVIGRLCATVARDAESLCSASEALGGRADEGGDLAYEFDAFPLLPIRLIWHAADEEFPPSATLLLPGNVESLLCVEDIVVLSERFVSRLAGEPF